MHRLTLRCVLVAAVATIAAACETNNFLIPPTGPTPEPVTETFAGVINPNGAVTHPFATQTGGTVTATLTAVNPEATIGLSLGTWNGVSCKIEVARDTATQGAAVIGTASGIGNFCVRIYDVGNLTDVTSYEVQVVHP